MQCSVGGVRDLDRGVRAARHGEVIFVDGQRRVHARRWCNRQSAWSAIRPETTEVLIVAEAMHENGPRDVRDLVDTLLADVSPLFGSCARHAMLTGAAPRFDGSVGPPVAPDPSARPVQPL